MVIHVPPLPLVSPVRVVVSGCPHKQRPGLPAAAARAALALRPDPVASAAAVSRARVGADPARPSVVDHGEPAHRRGPRGKQQQRQRGRASSACVSCR